jgi:NAD-dependent SIR2 family protein deacetylase
MIKDSNNCVVYTGAGISIAAGIGDWASNLRRPKKRI